MTSWPDLPADGQEIEWQRRGTATWTRGRVAFCWLGIEPAIKLDDGRNLFPTLGDQWRAAEGGNGVMWEWGFFAAWAVVILAWAWAAMRCIDDEPDKERSCSTHGRVLCDACWKALCRR
jgi:hypothetical protein